MDNLTHTLIGFAVAEAALQVRKPKQKAETETKALRPWLWFASFAANNAPDLDFLIPHGFAQKSLGYMLHHRGYTHTLLGALGTSALVLFVTWTLSRIRKPKLAWNWIAGVVFLGGWTHILADSWNSYGVHPFWPVDRRWFHGDFIFIVEPWIWISLAPMLAACASTKFAKWLLRAVPVLALGLAIYTDYVPTAILLPLILVTVAFEAASFKLKPTARNVYASIAICIAGILGFKVESRAAEKILRGAIARTFPSSQIRDVILSPMPATPVCWRALTVENDGGNHVLRRATVSTAPKWIGSADCVPNRKTDSKLQPILDYDSTAEIVKAPQSPAVLWEGQYSRPLSELEALKKENCVIEAFLHFARAPFWLPSQDRIYVGDARFDREQGPGFTEFQIARKLDPKDCAGIVPSWTPPLTF